MTSSTGPARILIADDHPVVRLGIRQLISTDPRLTVAAEADSCESAIRIATGPGVDMAIVDLSLAGGNGLTAIRTIAEAVPGLPVLVLSMHDEELFAERVLGAGARGYIMKDASADDLLHAIHEVLAGRIHLSTAMSQSLLHRIGRTPSMPTSRLANLTDRELEVFQAIGRGMSTAAIAQQLKVSVKTIETYRSNIKTKLDLRDAADLIRFATTWTEGL